MDDTNSVPVGPFIEAWERSGIPANELAIRCGVFRTDARGNVKGDTSWVFRRLGLRPEGVSASKGGGTHLKTSGRVSLGVAEKLCRGLALDPVDVGL